MKKIIPLTAGALVILGAVMFSQNEVNPISKEVLAKIEAKKAKKKGRLYPEGLSARNDKESISERRQEQLMKFANPTTGLIESNMRKKELDFAKTLPKSALTVDINHRGPYNVGGRTRAFAVDIENENILIAGGISGGIWKSIDGGATWQKKTSSTDFGSVTCLVQDKRPGKTQTWYYGTGEGYGNSASATSAFFFGNGMFKSEDNGETWNPIASTTTDNIVAFNSDWQLTWNIALDNSVDGLDIVYAAIYDGIHRSEDGGDSWTKVLGIGGNNAYSSNIIVTPTGMTYAFINSDETDDNNGVFLSKDHGVTWSEISPNNFPGTFERGVFDYNPSNENELYVFMNTPNFGKHTNTFFDGEDWNSLWKYTFNNSSTATQGDWVDLSDNLPDSGTSFATLYTQNGYDMAVKVHPTDENVIYLGGTNIYRSDDGFTTNQNTHFLGGYDENSIDTDWDITENHHPDQHLIYFPDSNSNVLYSINDGGIFKTNSPLANTSNWESLNNGYFTTQLYAVSVNQNETTNTILAGFQDNGNFVTKSSNLTDPWVLPYNGDGAFSYVAGDEENYYLSIQRGRVGKFSLDSDGNRVSYRRIDPAGIDRDGVSFIHPFAVDPNDEDFMFYPVKDTLFRQSNLTGIVEDNSATPLSGGWDFIADDLNLPGSNRITSVHVTKSNPENTVYLGTTMRRMFKIENATSSNPVVTTLGTTTADGLIAYSSGFTSCVTTNPDNGNEIIGVNTNYSSKSLTYSIDGGETFCDISGNLEEFPNGSGNGPSTRWASILPLNSGETLYLVGTSVGLFATDQLDTLNTVWSQVGADIIGNVVVEQVITRKSDGLILVATHGNGIFSMNVNQVSDVLNVDEVVIEKNNNFNIDVNPSRGELVYTSDLEGTVDISFIEVATGRLVKTMSIDSSKGQNRIETNLAKGTYSVTLRSGINQYSNKLVVL